MNWSDIPIMETLAEELRPLLPGHVIATGTDILVISSVEQDALDRSPKGLVKLLVDAPIVVNLDSRTGTMQFSHLVRGELGSYMLPHCYDLADPTSVERIVTDILRCVKP